MEKQELLDRAQGEDVLSLNSDLNILSLYREDLLHGNFEEIPTRVLGKFQDMGVIIRKYGTFKSRAVTVRGAIFMFAEELKNENTNSIPLYIIKKFNNMKILENGKITQRGREILQEFYSD